MIVSRRLEQPSRSEPISNHRLRKRIAAEASILLIAAAGLAVAFSIVSGPNNPSETLAQSALPAPIIPNPSIGVYEPKDCIRRVTTGASYDPERHSGTSSNGEVYAMKDFESYGELHTTAQDLLMLSVPISEDAFLALGFPRDAVVGWSSDACSWVTPQSR